jgi:hypothetical protein
MSNVWRLITQSRFEDACTAADEEYSSSGRASALRNKSFALLKLRRYSDVISLGRLLIEVTDGDTVDDFMCQGVAHWLSNEPDSAIECWREAQTARYQDAAGGVACRLLLWYGALRTDDIGLMRDLERWFQRKFTKAPMVWPAPLAGVVCRKLDKNSLMASLSPNPVLAVRQHCQGSFYLGMIAQQQGDHSQFSHLMHKAHSLESVTWLEYEHYLASGEVLRLDVEGQLRG